ncbi:MAG: T9SS type A sorting domain-containing protein [Bacteroidales bacterium]|nr:T9SS type A sorting domain-containing protein [Bacteroidales bacterium]
MKKMRYIRLIVLACLALVSLGAWGDNFVFKGPGNDWNDINNWGKGQATPYYTGWNAADRLPQSGDCIYINASVVCPNDLECLDFYTSAGVVFTCNGNLISQGHIHMYGGEVNVNGNIYCKNEFEQQSAASLTCTGSFTSENHVYVNGSVSIGDGGLDCKDVKVQNSSSSLACTGNVDTHGRNFEISGSVVVGGNISCGYFPMSDNSSLVCGGSVDTNNNNFQPNGSVDIAGNLNCGYLPLSSNTTFKVDGEFRATSMNIAWDLNGTEIIIDFLPDAINHSKEDTERIIQSLIDKGAYQEVKKNSWTGVESEDWFNNNNWYNAKTGAKSIPDQYTDVTIANTAANMPVISRSDLIHVRNIIIEDNCKLTLNAGARLHAKSISVVNSGNNDAIVINQTSGNMVSVLLQEPIKYKNGAYYNHVKINTTYPTGRYMYVGSETTEGNITTNGCMFYLHDHATDSYVSSSQYRDPFNQAGFLAKGGSGTFSVTQEGTILSSGSKTLDVRRYRTHEDGNTWCLLSNPFSYAYPLNNIECDNNVDPVLWFDNYTGSGYEYSTYSVATHTQVGDVAINSDVIAPQQAFYVRAHENAAPGAVGFLKFNALPSNYSLASSRLKSASVENDVLRLTLSSEGLNTDELAMVFREGGSLDVIYGDAEKMILEKTKNQIYAVKENKRMVIPYYPAAEDILDAELPLGLMLSSKSYQGTFTAKNIDMFNSEVNVFLRDNLTGEVVDLRENNAYLFEERGGQYISDRFSLILKSAENQEEALGSISTSINTDETISVYSTDGYIIVRSSVNNILPSDMVVRIYDVCGKMISKTKTSDVITKIPFGGKKGMYVVDVISSSISKTSKVLVW